MTYIVKMNHPQFPADTEFGISGLGRIVNDGSPLEIDEETERGFVTLYGLSIADAVKTTQGITLEGSSALSSNELKTLTLDEAPAPVVGFDSSAPVDETPTVVGGDEVNG